jgi:hypothetical protein
MIFIDGVGIGKSNPEVNPFIKYHFNSFGKVFGAVPTLDNQYLTSNDKYLFPVDACMGIDDLPQSGTGQTSIFTGTNAPEIVGHHFGPYPHSKTIDTLKSKNIFKEFLGRNLKVTFANAYPKIFFDYVNSGRRRLSATSLCCIYSGVKLKSSTDLRRGKALSAEIDNKRWVEMLNYNLPIIKPRTAARRLFRLAKENHFTLFEYFFTDHIGHGRYPELFAYVMKTLDEFLFYILTNLPGDISLVICSDHGNLEDISVKSHTRNPALGITAGKNAAELSRKIKYLYDIKPSIMEMHD